MPIVARSTRAVSARQLSRQMSALLDEIESQGTGLVVCRYGRPSAMLLPFREGADAIRLPRLDELPSLDAVESQEDRDRRLDETLDRLELDVAISSLLREIVTFEEGAWRLSDGLNGRTVTDLSVGVGRLELQGLVERGLGSIYTPTALGERYVQRLLDSEA